MSARTRRRRAEANYGPELGTTYLLHFDRPYIGANGKGMARHYIGWTQDLAARLDAHLRGRGARLVEVITRAGIGWTLARTWPETTKDREDLLKHAGGGRRYCPECGVKPRQEPAVVMPERRLSLYDLERGGTWLDGTPLPEITTYPASAAALDTAASRKENQMEHDEMEAAGELLSRHAAEAGDALRRERQATAYERFAQQAHDPDLLGLAQDVARNARWDRQAATRNAYAAAASLQRSAAGAEPDDAGGQLPLPRVLDASEASPELAPVATTLPDHTPHADPYLAARGWQAPGGIYVRQPQAQLEAG